MATLNQTKLRALRQDVATKVGMRPSLWSKQDLNAAFQALEDWYQANKASAAADMETAAPGLFSNAQKKEVADSYFDLRLG